MSRVDEKRLKLLKARYGGASNKEISEILDDFVRTTRYGRKYAIALLNGKRSHVTQIVRRPRRAKHDVGLIPPLLTLSDLFDGICSKRLYAVMRCLLC